jgi:hypothetical protein
MAVCRRLYAVGRFVYSRCLWLCPIRKEARVNKSPHSLLHTFANRSKQKMAKEAEISLLASFAFIGSIASPYSCLSGRAVQPRSRLD